MTKEIKKTEEALQESLQEKYMQYQSAEQQMKQLNQQAQVIEQQLMEMIIAKNAVEEIGKTKPGKEMLVPIANGVFAKTELKENQDVILNVGANTAVTMDMKAAQEMLEKQVEEITKVQAQIQLQTNMIAENANKLKTELQQLTGA